MGATTVCTWYWAILGSALGVAGLMAVFWRCQRGHTRQEHRKLVELTARLEETVRLRTRELDERNVALQEEVEARRRQAEALRLADTVFESAAEAIIVTDADNNIVRVNPAFTAITGYTPAEVMGRNPRLLKSGRHGPEFYRELWSDLDRIGHWEGEIWNRCKNGDIRVEWLSIAKILNGQDCVRHLAVFHDITRRKEAEEQLRFKAHHDALTELPNRGLFMDRLQIAINQARRYHRNFAQRYAALPAPMRADLAALSLHDKELGGLDARLILVHGRNDTLIPWPESLALAAAFPPTQARVFLLDAVLGHVDISLSHVLSWRFLTVELPDIVRMARAVDALLAERESRG